MPKHPARSSRVAEQIQHELAEVIRTEMKDPRIGLLTLTGVDLSPDFSHAKVFFTTLQGQAGSAAAVKALQHAAGFLRSELSHRMQLRSMPELRFVYDASVEEGVRLSKLIDDANAPRADDAPKAEE